MTEHYIRPCDEHCCEDRTLLTHTADSHCCETAEQNAADSTLHARRGVRDSGWWIVATCMDLFVCGLCLFKKP